MDRKTIGFVMTHGHMDIEWYMPLRSYRFWTVQALDELRRIAGEQPDCPPYVLDGVTYVLDLYLEARPEARKEMLQLIAEGKLSVGPFFSQFDEWLPSAEAIVRNCLYGNRTCREYGSIMKAGYLPDNFGHPMQLPQILQNFGIDSLLFMRGMPEIPGGHPDEFHYKGLDGSVVLASHFREGYDKAFDIWGIDADPLQPRDMPYYSGYFSYELLMEMASHPDQADVASQMIRNATRMKERYPSGIVPLVAGCDHCPPQKKMAQTVALANRMQTEIAFVMGDAQEYVALVRDHLREIPTYSMELIGSFFQYILFGALSTRSYLKRLHFGAEALMERYAEPLDAFASLYGYAGERPQMDEAWKYLMINSAHDSIHGSSMDEVHTEMESRYAAVMQIATGVAHEAIKFLGTHMAPWWIGKGKGILAFSPANPGIPQLGQVWLPIGDATVCIHDADGNALPTQVQPREPIALNGMGKPRNSAWPDKRLVAPARQGDGCLAPRVEPVGRGRGCGGCMGLLSPLDGRGGCSFQPVPFHQPVGGVGTCTIDDRDLWRHERACRIDRGRKEHAPGGHACPFPGQLGTTRQTDRCEACPGKPGEGSSRAPADSIGHPNGQGHLPGTLRHSGTSG